MSSDKGIFRKEAMARKGLAEPLDGLLRVTAPHEWVILVWLGLVLLGFAGWGLFGNIERTLSSECVLLRSGDRYSVISAVTGNVEEILVEVGDSVEAGQPLARIRAPRTEHHLRIARARVERLEKELEGSPGGLTHQALFAARSDVIELESLLEAGQFVLSPEAGQITAQSLVPGQRVLVDAEVATIRKGDDNRLEAVTLIPPDRARFIQRGQRTKIFPSAFTAGVRVIQAQVSSVSDRSITPPEWLTSLGLETPPGHMVRVAVPEDAVPLVDDGDRCSLRIVFGEHPPVRLLWPR